MKAIQVGVPSQPAVSEQKVSAAESPTIGHWLWQPTHDP